MFARYNHLRICCIVAACFLWIVSYSSAACAAPPKPVRGLFWRVSTPKSTFYLLGSVHLGTTDMYPLPDAIERAFKQSAILIVEVDLNKIDAAEQQRISRYVAANGTYGADDSLWKHVSVATKAKVQAFCADNQIPSEAFAKTKPWLLAITASVLPLQKLGMKAGLGIDKYFLDRASNTKQIEQLETAVGQIQLLSDIPAALEERYVAVSLQQAGRYREIGANLQRAWIDGDAAGMDELLSRWFSEPAAFAKRLREDRNPHMAAVAETHLRKGDACFMVVGAAHLVGKEGVIRLLQQKGYKVEQVIAAAGMDK